MSTDCMVMRKGKSSGRYVHFGARPKVMLKILLDLSHEHGYPNMVKTVVDDNIYGWSYIDPTYEDRSKNISSNRFKVVKGYGLAYSGTDIPESNITIGSVEYSYVFDNTGNIEVYRYNKLLGAMDVTHPMASQQIAMIDMLI